MCFVHGEKSDLRLVQQFQGAWHQESLWGDVEQVELIGLEGVFDGPGSGGGER